MGFSPNRVLSIGEFNQSDCEALRATANQISRTWKIAPIGYFDMGFSPNRVLSIGEFNQSDCEALRATANQISRTWKIAPIGYFNMEFSPNRVLSIREFNQLSFNRAEKKRKTPISMFTYVSK
jgi:hypothetical protein